MKKTLDFNKLAKAHRAKKSWQLLQEEKTLETADLDANQNVAKKDTKSRPERRKSS